MPLPTLPFQTAHIGFTTHNFSGKLSWAPSGQLFLAGPGLPKAEFRMDREIDDISVRIQILTSQIMLI
jgi:hypothetical protein